VDAAKHAQELVDTTHNKFQVLADMSHLLQYLAALHATTPLLVNHNSLVVVKKCVLY
jgi:hypothetical protein